MSQADIAQLENLQKVLQAYKGGDIQAAYQLCKEFIAASPNSISLLQFLGLMSIELHSYQEAIDAFSKAIKLSPNDPFLWSGVAQAFEASGDIDQASGCYQKALGIDPTCIEALLGLAPIFQQQKNYDDAQVCYEAALNLEPNSSDILNNLGSLYLESGRLQDAYATLQKAIGLNPSFVNAYYNLSFACKGLNQLDAAKLALEKAIALYPGFADAHFQLGIIYKLSGLHDDELASYEKAAAIKPNDVMFQTRLGFIYSVQGNIDAAKKSYQILQQLEPHNPLWPLRLASLVPIVMPNLESVHQSRATVNRMLDALEKNTEPFQVRDIGQTYAIPPYHWLYHGVDDTKLRSRFADYLYQRMEMDDYDPKPLPLGGRKIKVGFLCTENRENSMWVLQGGFIQKLNRELFDVAIIGTTQTLPELKKKLASEPVRFIDLPIEIPDIVSVLRQEQLDVIHFFEVGSDPKNYFLPFYRMAPVQCTSWGILSTTGISNMDYYLSSIWFESPEDQVHYRETLVNLDSSLAYYQEPQMPAAFLSRAELGLPEDKTIYASPHSLFKFQPEFDDYLVAILEKDPMGAIVLNESQNPIILADLKARLKRNLGVLYERVLFLGYLPWQQYTSLMKASDILLDPLHFGGGVTSYNAFALGKPVVTQPTAFLRGRITSGMYRMMGIDDCVVDSKQAYVDKCVEIANNPDLQRELSEKILKQKHLLFCDEAMVKALETFFIKSVEQALQA